MKKQICLLVVLALVVSVLAMPITSMAASTSIIEVNGVERLKLSKIESAFDMLEEDYFDEFTEYECEKGATLTILEDNAIALMFVTLSEKVSGSRNGFVAPDNYTRADLNEQGQIFDLPAGSTYTFSKPGMFYYHIMFTDGASAGGYINIYDENGKAKYYDSIEEYEGNAGNQQKNEPVPVVSKAQKLQLNEIGFASVDAYNIYDNNYIKLRDFAYFVSENASNMKKLFDVTWDESKNAINLITEKEYTVAGGEMNLNEGVSATATLSTSSVYLNGEYISLTAYTINGNNYFKLRDLCEALDISITWWEKGQVIYINDQNPYGAEFEEIYSEL